MKRRLSSISAPQDVAAGLLLIAASVAVLFLTSGLDLGTLRSMGPGMVPRVLAAMTLLLGLVIVATGFLVEGPALERWRLRGLVLILAAIALFAITIRPLGLAVAGPVVIFIGGLADREARLRDLIVVAAVMSALCVLLFKFLLRLPIPVAPWALGY